MLSLRLYQARDAEDITSWNTDERAFYWWSADRFAHYPITAAELDAYLVRGGKEDACFSLCAYDEAGLAGHVLVRALDEARRDIRLGMIIVNPARRGEGMGRHMLALAQRFAFEFLNAERVTLGVFEENAAARRCYLAAGLRFLPQVPVSVVRRMDEKMRVAEMGITRREWMTAQRGLQRTKAEEDVRPW